MKDPLHYLYGLQRFGIKAGLRNISVIAGALGNPELTYPVIHIAGTNGKGSTAAMVASILTSAGYRTGLYTSPHLVRFNERIRVNGSEISDHELIRYTNLVHPLVERMKATFFEATTAIAFQYFADKGVEVAVIEAGLGGRWDATNIVRPLLSIITSVDYDHTEYLGKTLRSIAKEKGGIIKWKTPCLTGVADENAYAVIARMAKKHHAPLTRAGSVAKIGLIESQPGGITANLRTKRRSYRKLAVGLGGAHQGSNLALAVLAVESLSRSFPRIGENEIRNGLSSLRDYTGFRGRLEVLSRSPLIIADVGHNTGALRTIAGELGTVIGKKMLVVFGVMKDKEYRPMVAEIGRMARLVVSVAPDTPRALGSRLLTEEFHRIGVPSLDGKSVSAGVVTALRERRKDEPVLIIGSHFVVGEAIPAIEKMGRTLKFQ